MTNRLAGWVWLWLAFTVGIWAFGGWTLIAMGLPRDPTAHEACSYVGFSTPPADPAGYERWCLAHPEIEAAFRRRFLSEARMMFAAVAAFWFLIPMGLGLVLYGLDRAVSWLRRRSSRTTAK